MITHITLAPLKLNPQLSKAIFNIEALDETLIQLKQATSDHVVIECDIDVPKKNMNDLKRNIKDETGASIINFTYNDKK